MVSNDDPLLIYLNNINPWSNPRAVAEEIRPVLKKIHDSTDIADVKGYFHLISLLYFFADCPRQKIKTVDPLRGALERFIRDERVQTEFNTEFDLAQGGDYDHFSSVQTNSVYPAKAQALMYAYRGYKLLLSCAFFPNQHAKRLKTETIARNGVSFFSHAASLTTLEEPKEVYIELANHFKTYVHQARKAKDDGFIDLDLMGN
jgi:hypothetical protein